MKSKQIFILCILFFSQHFLFAQHEAKLEHHGMKGSNRLTLGLGHTHVSEGKIDIDTKWLAVAFWSLNNDYWTSDKWAIGLQNDLLQESFIIEDDHHEEIERHYPVAVVPAALFKPGKHFTFIAGVGKEFACGHSLTLTRPGIEYGWHLPKNREAGTAMVWDGKWNYYNSS